jgi:HEAT repeat protein
MGRHQAEAPRFDMWDAFISHASDDKAAVARPIALELERRGLRVWFDEFSLTVGDSLRRSVDYGLANSRFGVVIFSPSFFQKAWPQRELDGLLAKETTSEKVILPVWHKIDRDEIEAYSPMLAERIGVSTSIGIAQVADALCRAIVGTAKTSQGKVPAFPAKGLELVNVSVDSEKCFYREETKPDGLHVLPTKDYNPLSPGEARSIFPILDFKLRNTDTNPVFVWRLWIQVLGKSDLAWDKQYYPPPGPVEVSARYDVLLDRANSAGSLAYNVSFSVPAHDVERFQMQFASEEPAVYRIRIDIDFNVGQRVSAGVFSLTIPGSYSFPLAERVIGPNLEDKIVALKDPTDRLGRAVAARALEKIGSRRACADLKNALRDPDPRVRATAAAALATCGDGSAAQPLLKLLRSDPDVNVKAAAAKTLGSLRIEEAVEELDWALCADDEGLKSAACIALGEIGGKTAIESLVSVAQREPSSMCGHHALKALGHFKHPQVIDLLTTMVKQDRPPQAAISALRELMDAKTVDLFTQLLDSSDSWTRREAAEALGYLEAREAKPKLIETCEHDECRDVRHAAARSLALLGDSNYLGRVLNSSEWSDGEWFIDKLSEASTSNAQSVIRVLSTSHTDPHVRVRSAIAMLHLDAEQAAVIIEREMGLSKAGVEAGEALAKAGFESGKKQLLAILNKSDDKELRLLASCALGRLGDDAGYSEMVNTLPSRRTLSLEGKAVSPISYLMWSQRCGIAEIADALKQLGKWEAIFPLREAWHALQQRIRPSLWGSMLNDPIEAIEIAIERLTTSDIE